VNRDNPFITPFRGIHYHLGKISDFSKVTAPPYDVISESLQKKLYEISPCNIVRLDLGRQFPTDNEQNNRYTRAAKDLQSWLREGVLVRDEEPSYYLYEQIFEVAGKGRFQRRGFFALRQLEEFDKGNILPHEKTLSGPKADRLLLMKATQSNLSSIFSLYSDPEQKMAALLKPYFEKDPMIHFIDDYQIEHRLWRVSDPVLFQKTHEILGKKKLFIADGHHRYETGITYRNWRRSQEAPDSHEKAGYDSILMFFAEMSDPGLLILPTHRVLQNWPGFDKNHFKQEISRFFEIKSFKPDQKEVFLKTLQESEKDHAFGVLLPGEAEMLLITLSKQKGGGIPRLGDLPASLQEVDTAILHESLFRGILGLGDVDEKNQKFLRFIKETDEAFKARNESGVNCVFIMNCPQMDVLKKVTEEGLILPPKTTYFYPKILTGLVLNQLDTVPRVVI